MVRAARDRGYAKEAARSLVGVLREAGWTVVAHIHPGHLASHRVARAAGISPTTAVRGGETRWVSPSATAPYSGNSGQTDVLNRRQLRVHSSECRVSAEAAAEHRQTL